MELTDANNPFPVGSPQVFAVTNS